MNELFNVKDKVVVITGGAGILGKGIAAYLAKEGAKVVVLDRSEEAGKALVDSIKAEGNEAMFLYTDVMDKEVLEGNKVEIMKAYGRIDVLLNAAGGNMAGATIAPDKTFFDLQIDAFKKVVDLNLFGTVLPTMVFAEIMVEQKKGSIVNFCSESALRPLTRVVGYGAAKAAIANFTKYMAELKQLWENDRLEFHGSAAPYKNYYTFKELLNTCYAKEWIPYCKKPFDGAESVIRYLGKYTHRIAISNYRIKDMTESTVTFSAKDYKNQGLWKEITISGEEFIRRFLMHVPPKRFVRIRHYGLLSSRNKKKKITLCRNILGCKKYISKLKDMDAPAIIRLLYNKDICKCSSCGGKIIPLPTEQHFIKPKPHMLC